MGEGANRSRADGVRDEEDELLAEVESRRRRATRADVLQLRPIRGAADMLWEVQKRWWTRRLGWERKHPSGGKKAKIYA